MLLWQLFKEPKKPAVSKSNSTQNPLLVFFCQVDFIEIHAAHGYLLHAFLSPLSNTRSDENGGQPLQNRLRFPLRLIKSCREAWPEKPLFVRISATDWAEGPEKDEQGIWKQWGIDQSTIFVGKLQELGVDLIDCSSGGNWVHQKIPLKPGYQVRYPFVHWNTLTLD